MLLALDVGNTNTVLGVFRDAALIHSWRLTTLRERTADELGMLITGLCGHHHVTRDEIVGIVMASVVPPLTGTMITMARDYFGQTPLNVEPAVNTGMPIRYENPAEVGADRVVNGIAAYEEYGRPRGRPVIVVDFGTATTFDAISAAGEYLGGVICPGPQISADALFQRAARLPRIDVRSARSCDRAHDRGLDAGRIVLGLRGHGGRAGAPHAGGARRRRRGGGDGRPRRERGAGDAGRRSGGPRVDP